MSEDKPKGYEKTKLLNRYYEKVGLAAAGRGHCPHFVEFRAGFGLVDDTDPENPKLLNIPPNMVEVPRECYRGLIEAEYSNGVTMCSCIIPTGGVDKPMRYNMVGIIDQDGDLVAVCTTFPDWVTPSEGDRSFPALAFPLEDESK